MESGHGIPSFLRCMGQALDSIQHGTCAGLNSHELARIAAELKQDRYLHGADRDEFVRRAAYYWSEWNAIHPHLDGNGRSCREVLRTLALQADYKLSWSGLRKEGVSHASALSWSCGDTSAMERILGDRLVPMPTMDTKRFFRKLPGDFHQ